MSRLRYSREELLAGMKDPGCFEAGRKTLPPETLSYLSVTWFPDASPLEVWAKIGNRRGSSTKSQWTRS